MYPNLHLPFGLSLPSHAVMLSLAVALCWSIGPRWALREGIRVRDSIGVLFWLGIAAIVGGRLHFLANLGGFGVYRSHPADALRFWNGLHAGGALVAMAVATPLLLRAYRIHAGRFADAFVPTILLGVAAARLGCFLNGCCFGSLCHAAWCVRYPRESAVFRFQAAAGLISPEATATDPVHPVQLYFALAAIIAAVLGRTIDARKSYDGQPALVAISSFLVLATFTELLRANYYPRQYTWLGTLQFVWISTAMAVLAILTLSATYARYRWQNRPPSTAVDVSKIRIVHRSTSRREGETR